MKLKPLYDRVIVTDLPAEEKTAGGVILPDTAKEKPTKGKVVAVGSGHRNAIRLENGDVEIEDSRMIGLCVKAGDIVWYGKYSGTDVKVDGQEFKILKEKDILGIEE